MSIADKMLNILYLIQSKYIIISLGFIGVPTRRMKGWTGIFSFERYKIYSSISPIVFLNIKNESCESLIEYLTWFFLPLPSLVTFLEVGTNIECNK